MFNAANILEALKNYIRTRGGTSDAYNIAEAVNDLNSIPQGSGGGIPEAPVDDKQYARKNGDWSEVESSGGDIPPEVSNAVETHGMGWTDEEVVEGFDIQWDGNTEGLESFFGRLFKISDKVYTEDELDGANGEYIMDDVTYKGIVSLFIPERQDDELDFVRFYEISGDVPQAFGFNQAIMVILDDVEMETEEGVMIFHKGTYFDGLPDVGYTSHIYKEASTEEVVHQIDQKYIPQSSGGGMVVKVLVTSNDGTASLSADKTIAEIRTAYQSGQTVIAHMYAESGGFDEWLSLTYVNTSGQLWFGFPYPNDEGSPLLMLFATSEDGTDVWGSDILQ